MFYLYFNLQVQGMPVVLVALNWACSYLQLMQDVGIVTSIIILAGMLGHAQLQRWQINIHTSLTATTSSLSTNSNNCFTEINQNK